MNSELLLFRWLDILNFLHSRASNWNSKLVKVGTHASEALLTTRSTPLTEDVNINLYFTIKL